MFQQRHLMDLWGEGFPSTWQYDMNDMNKGLNKKKHVIKTQ
jgi:hypothetical protein